MSDKPKTGRPSKYNEEEILKSCEKYLDFGLFETYQKEIVIKDQIQVINLERPNSIPSIAGLATHLGIHRDTVYEWAKIHDRFSDTLDRLQRKQEEFLLYHGLTKGYDSGFAKFITQNVTRFRDKIEQKSDVKTDIKLSYSIDE